VRNPTTIRYPSDLTDAERVGINTYWASRNWGSPRATGAHGGTLAQLGLSLRATEAHDRVQLRLTAGEACGSLQDLSVSPYRSPASAAGSFSGSSTEAQARPTCLMQETMRVSSALRLSTGSRKSVPGSVPGWGDPDLTPPSPPATHGGGDPAPPRSVPGARTPLSRHVLPRPWAGTPQRRARPAAQRPASARQRGEYSRRSQ